MSDLLAWPAMDREHHETRPDRENVRTEAYEPPSFEVISLSCEITAYAPDDEPLF